MSSQLPNYLRSNRKRAALSQEDVAFLLGALNGSQVSRYEHFDRMPGLKTALAFEVIYQKPVKELFAGIYKKIEQEVAARARVRAKQENRGKGGRLTNKRKGTFLKLTTPKNPNE